MRIKNKLFNRKKEYPRIDNLVVVYVAVVLYFQLLLQISPIVTSLTATPLYNIQTYLGLLGGGLIVLDLFTTKRIWQGNYIGLLCVILVFAALASVRMISYGIKENLFKLCWMAIQFVLVYTCGYRIDKAQLETRIRILFYGLLIIWCYAACISLYQYVTQYGYKEVVNPLAVDTSSNRQGFYDHRLFGIYYTLNHAAYISLLFVTIALVFLLREKRTWVRILLIAAEVVLVFHIILSGSRSAMVAMLVCVGVVSWFVARQMIKLNGLSKPLVCCVVSAAMMVLCYCGYQGLKRGLAYVPHIVGTTRGEHAGTQNAANDRMKNMTRSGLLSAFVVGNGADFSDTVSLPKLATITPGEEVADVLNREENPDGDISNGRLEIWADYIHLYKDIGVVGLSPGNYMPYILENYPDLYIVDEVKRFYPDKYNSGIIHHVHSGYMMVYVSAGMVGILSLVVYMLLCLRRFLRMVQKNKKLSHMFLGALALVIAVAVSAVFDEGLFFQNNPQTTIFWFALGLLMSGRLQDAEIAVQEQNEIAYKEERC